MPKFLFLGLMLLVPLMLRAQYVGGSVVVIEPGGDYIAIAADSLRLGPASGQVSHAACKIVELSDQLVFAATGISSHPGGQKTVRSDIWNVNDIARQEYSALASKHADHLIQKLADAYGTRLAAKLNDGLKREPRLLAFLSSEVGGSAAVFAGFDEQHHRVMVEVTVGIQAQGAHTVGYAIKFLPGDEAVGTEIIGDTTIAQELAVGKTKRSQGWSRAMLFQTAGLGLKDRLLFGAERIVGLTAIYDPHLVGGPVDVILVTRGHGVTWVHRKPTCGHYEHGKKSANF